jgi:high-affinity Fe2+/Pb2+ permease
MFRKTVQPLDLLLAVLAAIVPGAAIFYWLASNGRLPFEFMFGVAYLLTAAGVMLGVIGGMIAFAMWFFSPRR